MKLREIVYECVDSIYVTRDRVHPTSLVDTVMNLLVV
jgi:hypothetical protein